MIPLHIGFVIQVGPKVYADINNFIENVKAMPYSDKLKCKRELINQSGAQIELTTRLFEWHYYVLSVVMNIITRCLQDIRTGGHLCTSSSSSDATLGVRLPGRGGPSQMLNLSVASPYLCQSFGW